MKKLKDIIECDYNIPIQDIKTDSREVKKGDLFVAVKGFNIDHSLYIDDAIKNGAVAIITDKDYKSNVPIIKVNDIDKVLVDICKKKYDFNSNLKLIGVTGTDGKTTTATIIKRLLDKKDKTAYIGTNGIEYLNKKESISNTTPTVEKLYKYFSDIDKNNISTVCMEVSSEALLHKRVDSLRFKYVVYTNITEDHLNIHKTIENYIESKLKLSTLLDSNGIIIINNDDNKQKDLKNSNKKIYTYGKNKDSDFLIKDIKYLDNITRFIIEHNNKQYKIKSTLLGEYNIYNLTAAFIVCYLEGMKPRNIISNIKRLSSIDGRGEILSFGQKYTIVLDYAHTENSIKNIVEEVKDKYKRIIVVTGSAGGREKEKRKHIGKYLLDNTDLVIFTMDDPRCENVDYIIDDMISISNKTNYKRIISRSNAIKYALDIAKEDDIVLILGKGRDNYMAIGDEKIPYNDYEEIEEYFTRKIVK